MKRLLCTVCIVALLMVNISQLSMASDFFCVLETFDDGVSDEFSFPAGASIVETEDGRSAMELNGELNVTWAQAGFEAIRGLFMASCEFMQPQRGTADVLRVHNSSGGSEIARVWVEGGSIKMQSGANGITIGSYDTNVWYRIDIIGDTTTKTGLVYVNGVLRGNFGFIQSAAFDVGNVICFNRSNTVTYIDNMYLVPFKSVDSALYFAETFGDTLNNSDMYSSAGLNGVYSAFQKIAESASLEELDAAKTYLEECKYKVLTADGEADYSKEISFNGDVLISESEFKLTSGGGANVLSLSSESDTYIEMTASESDGLVLKYGGGGELTVADSLVPDKWYSLKVISDSAQNKVSILVDGVLVFEGDVNLGTQNVCSLGVSADAGYEGSCIIGGAVSATESESYEMSRDILRAKGSLSFYPELYTEEEIKIINDSITILEDKSALSEEKEAAFDNMNKTAYDLQMKMTSSSDFSLGKMYVTDALEGFGVFDGSFAVISSECGKTTVFEAIDSESGNAFCSLFVRDGALYAESGNSEVLLCDSIGLFETNKLTVVADVSAGKIRVFLNDTYLDASEDVECNASLVSADRVAVKLNERNSSVALRDDYTLNKVTGADIDNVDSMEKLGFAVLISDFIRDVNNSSRSSIGTLITNNEELLYDYGLSSEYASLSESEKSSVCLNIINKTFDSVEAITSELNIQIDNYYDSLYQPSYSGGGGSSSGSNRVSVSKPVTLTVPDIPVTVVPDNSQTEQKNNIADTFAFEDVDENHWCYDYIKSLNEKGIINGVTETLFSPDSNVKREEFIKLIVSALGINTSVGYSAFNDVYADAWYAPYINAAHSAGIVSGDDNGCFGVGRDITREEMFTIIYRAALVSGAELLSVDISGNYSDFGDVSDYAKDAVSSLISEGIVSGMSDSTIAPKATATRAMAAKLAHMLIEKGWGL